MNNTVVVDESLVGCGGLEDGEINEVNASVPVDDVSALVNRACGKDRVVDVRLEFSDNHSMNHLGFSVSSRPIGHSLVDSNHQS